MPPAHPVEVLWCDRIRRGRRPGWCFPAKVEQLLRTLTEGQSVLHLFGGRAGWGVRLDIDQLVDPDVIGDAWLPPFARDSFDVVILDPPYARVNAVEKMALFRAAGWVARRRLIWFHTVWVSAGSGLALERSWLVRIGNNSLVRCLEVFRVKADKPGPVRYFARGPAMKYNRWLTGNRVLPL